jgi:hypothetical protein
MSVLATRDCGHVWEPPAPPANAGASQASSTAMIPVRKMPSNVPAPPIDTTGVRSVARFLRLSRSAPINTPNVPEMYATMGACAGASSNAMSADRMGG